MLEERTVKLAEDLRKAGLNFIFVVEDHEGIHTNHSLTGPTILREVLKTVKSIMK